jgi:hypothetical protein
VRVPELGRTLILAQRGQLGNGSTFGSATPVHVSGLNGVTAIAGRYHTGYALRGDGTVWNSGSNPSSLTAVQVPG